MQSADFDLICLGSGPAGQKAAIQAAKAGFRACIIEREPQVGGSCLLSGTIPSKALREQALRYRRMQGSASSLAVELRGDAPLSALLHGVDAVIAAQDKYLLAQLQRNGVELIRGKGRFLDAHRIEIQHLDGSRRVLQSPRVLLATGSSYKQAMADRRSPDAFANDLTGVYATDPDYGNKLSQLLNGGTLRAALNSRLAKL